MAKPVDLVSDRDRNSRLLAAVAIGSHNAVNVIDAINEAKRKFSRNFVIAKNETSLCMEKLPILPQKRIEFVRKKCRFCRKKMSRVCSE
jgi:hypothetical protein